MGAVITGYSLAPATNPNAFTACSIKDLCEASVENDIQDLIPLTTAIKASKAEIIFHLAAQPLVRHSYEAPIETFSTNVLGTVNLFEACLSSSHIKAVINITSDKCYENKESLEGYIETSPMGGHDPYSASKGCSELVTNAYRKSFMESKGIALASARAGNVIGGGDWSDDRLIPDAVKALSRNAIVHIRSPFSVRPWQHVLEPLSGYLLLAQALYKEPSKFSSGWNFGPNPDSHLNVENIIQKATSHWSDTAKYSICDQTGPHEAKLLTLNSDKARIQLNWDPVWNTDEAVKQTIKWYKAYYNQEDMQAVSKAQIDEYLSQPALPETYK